MSSTDEPLLPTTTGDARRGTSKTRASLSDAYLIAIGTAILSIGAMLISVFPTSLPPQYHSRPASCSEGDKAHLNLGPAVPHGHYFWPQQKGNSNKSGAASYLTPDCMSHAPTWKWVDPLGAVQSSTPIIDHEKNIYMSTRDGRVIKFNQYGLILWNYTSTRGRTPGVPALLNGMIIQSTHLGFVFALDMEEGKEVWSTQIAIPCPSDAAGILVVDKVIVLASGSAGDVGNKQVVALTQDGLIKWTYTLQHGFLVYNFQASSPGDGTVVFMDSSGGLYRLSLTTGELIWESGIKNRKVAVSGLNPDLSFQVSWFSTGAAVTGPDGVVYCASNEGSTGIFHAYRLKDGKPLWRTNVKLSAMTGLAVGYLAGGSELAVVAGVGANPGLVTFIKAIIYSIIVFPFAICACSCFLCRRWRNGQGASSHCDRAFTRKAWRMFIWILMVLFLTAFFAELSLGANILSVNWKDAPNWLFLTKAYSQRVVALNAADGSPRWSYELPAFRRAAAAGDEEHLFARLKLGSFGDSTCLPDSFNQGVINGFGSVFIGHADGRLYAIRDSNADRHINPETEVSYYAFGEAFQAGVGLAPGLAAVVPCGGGLYVWK